MFTLQLEEVEVIFFLSFFFFVYSHLIKHRLASISFVLICVQVIFALQLPLMSRIRTDAVPIVRCVIHQVSILVCLYILNRLKKCVSPLMRLQLDAVWSPAHSWKTYLMFFFTLLLNDFS